MSSSEINEYFKKETFENSRKSNKIAEDDLRNDILNISNRKSLTIRSQATIA